MATVVAFGGESVKTQSDKNENKHTYHPDRFRRIGGCNIDLRATARLYLLPS